MSQALLIGYVVFGILNTIGIFYNIRAWRNLSDQPRSKGQLLRMGPFAPQSVFSATGWRFRNRALAYHTAGFLAMLFALLVA